MGILKKAAIMYQEYFSNCHHFFMWQLVLWKYFKFHCLDRLKEHHDHKRVNSAKESFHSLIEDKEKYCKWIT